MNAKEKRDRTKDRLLDNYGEAIKQLQIESCHSPHTVFTGDMCQVDELCTRINRIFYHGLKHKVDGYWHFVRDLTHKTVFNTIERLPHVRSNGGKCYIWLYLAINEYGLESYLRAVLAHPDQTKSFYLPHALLRDSQRLHLLIMLTAGLEHLPFSLNWNDPLKCKRGSVSTISSEMGCDSEVEEADCASLGSYSLSSNVEEQHSKESDDDPEVAVVTLVTFNPETGQPIKFCEENDVVHVSTRMTRRRRKERPINNNISSSQEETKTDVLDGSLVLIPRVIARFGTLDRERFLESILNNQTNLFIKDKEVEVMTDEAVRSPSCGEEKSVYDNNDAVLKSEEKFENRIELAHIEEQNVSCVEIGSGESTVLDMSERGVPEGQEDPMITSSISFKRQVLDKSKLDCGWLPFSQLPTPSKSVVKTNSDQLRAEINNETVLGKEQQIQQQKSGEVDVDNNFLLLIMLEVVIDQDEKVYKVYRGITGHTVGSPLEIYVVLTDQRLYLTHWNDLEGEDRFIVDSAISHSEIEFIQLGLNGQFVNIVCASPRRRCWISTGDEETSKNIISNLEISMRRNPRISCSALPGVYTQATMQSIAIRKWVAKNIGLDNFESVKVDHYALIRWEDPHAAQSTSNTPAGPTKEGFLMYLYTGSKAEFGTETPWRAAYFRLKAGVLYHFNDPLESTFRNYVQLVDGECVGCRHLPNSSRPYTFEILLTEGRSLRLAASNEEDASLWLQMILQSVAQGYLGEEVISPCISGCLVMAAEFLFVCHEQLETNALTLLAKAQLQDVSAVHLDSTEGSTYCIVEFESVEAIESNGDWVLYFASEKELSKFVSVIESTWSALYKVPLTINHKLDPVIQKRFHSTQNFFTPIHIT